MKFERRLLGRGARRMQLQKPVRTGRQQKATEWVETRTQAEWEAERDMSFGHDVAEEKSQRVEEEVQIRSRRKSIAVRREGSTLFQLARSDFSTYDARLTRKMARCPLSVHGWARHRAEQVKADKKDWLALLPELDTEREKISEAALAACGRLAVTEALFVRSWERQQHPQDQGASARTDARRAKVVREAARLAISRRQLQGLVVTVNQVILGAKVRCWTNGENADNKWVKRWASVMQLQQPQLETDWRCCWLVDNCDGAHRWPDVVDGGNVGRAATVLDDERVRMFGGMVIAETADTVTVQTHRQGAHRVLRRRVQLGALNADGWPEARGSEPDDGVREMADSLRATAREWSIDDEVLVQMWPIRLVFPRRYFLTETELAARVRRVPRNRRGSSPVLFVDGEWDIPNQDIRDILDGKAKILELRCDRMRKERRERVEAEAREAMEDESDEDDDESDEGDGGGRGKPMIRRDSGRALRSKALEVTTGPELRGQRANLDRYRTGEHSASAVGSPHQSSGSDGIIVEQASNAEMEELGYRGQDRGTDG